MVAKSFKNFIMLSEPYLKSGKMYINIKNPSTGTERTVRWYTEAEYYKMYPEEKVTEVKEVTLSFKTQREVLGFGDHGYILITKPGEIDEDWLSASAARYCRLWGWYFLAEDFPPEDIPISSATYLLKWDEVGLPSGNLKTGREVETAVNALLYPASNSQYQGEIGERLEINITVTKNISLENKFEKFNLIYMEDALGNEYLWSTSAKDWPVGTVKTIRGTVKQHKLEKNSKITVLTRCQERS